MNLRTVIILAILTPFFCIAQESGGQLDWTRECEPIEKAFVEIKTLNKFNLAAVYKIYKTYTRISSEALGPPRCDDGYFGQGMSDIVAKSLAADFANIIKSANENNGMAEFIMRHLDATVDWNDLDKITVQSENFCPIKAKILCKRIAHASKKASEEAKSPLGRQM